MLLSEPDLMFEPEIIPIFHSFSGIYIKMSYLFLWAENARMFNNYGNHSTVIFTTHSP